MGNKLDVKKAEPECAPSTMIGRALHHFEYKTGKMLVAAIKKDSKEAIDEAVEFARKELIKPRRSGVSNSTDFDDMNEGLVRYLTQDTDVGHGQLFTQTPLYFAKTTCKANVAAAAIQEHLNRLEGRREEGGRQVKGVGVVDASRAELAKERLKAFQANRKE